MKDNAIQLVGEGDVGTVGDLKIDLKYDDQNKIVSGLSIGNTLNQNMALLLIAEPGELKEYPTRGAGFKSQLLGEDLLASRHAIRENFEWDGLKIEELEVYDTKNIKIQAYYGQNG